MSWSGRRAVQARCGSAAGGPRSCRVLRSSSDASGRSSTGVQRRAGGRSRTSGRAPREDRVLADEAAAQQQADQQQERPAVEHELLHPRQALDGRQRQRGAAEEEQKGAGRAHGAAKRRRTLTPGTVAAVKLRLSVAVVLTAFVAGCGGGGEDSTPPASAGGRREALLRQLRQLPHARGRRRLGQGRPGPRSAAPGPGPRHDPGQQRRRRDARVQGQADRRADQGDRRLRLGRTPASSHRLRATAFAARRGATPRTRRLRGGRASAERPRVERERDGRCHRRRGVRARRRREAGASRTRRAGAGRRRSGRRRGPARPRRR